MTAPESIVGVPIAGAEEWRAVMERAGYRCQCTYTRHDAHRRNQGGRCERDAVASKLIAGPADPGPHPERRIIPIPVDELVAWCPPCWDHAVTQARKRANAEKKRQARTAPGLW